MSQNENPKVLFPGLKSNGDGTVSLSRPVPFENVAEFSYTAKYSDKAQRDIDGLRKMIDQMQQAIVAECIKRNFDHHQTVQAVLESKTIKAMQASLLEIYRTGVPVHTFTAPIK